MANKKLSAEQINIVLSDLKEQGHEVIMTALKVANRSSALKNRITNAARDHTKGCECVAGRDIFRIPGWNKLVQPLSPSGFIVPKGTKAFDRNYFCKCQVILGTRKGVSSVNPTNSPAKNVSKPQESASSKPKGMVWKKGNIR